MTARATAGQESPAAFQELDDFFRSALNKMKGPLRRSRRHRLIGGVIAGWADYLGMDITLARALYVLISICSAAFPGVLVYIIFWILTPEEPEAIEGEIHRG